jgi:hypothetical protein
MHTDDYIGEKTGLLLVDPYNDFLSPVGKLPIENKPEKGKILCNHSLLSALNCRSHSNVYVQASRNHRYLSKLEIGLWRAQSSRIQQAG